MTLLQVQSAFMIDLNQVSLALRNSTARSLIILDEFGKGTLPAGSYDPCFEPLFLLTPRPFGGILSDGAGLFCGVLKHLLERGTSCPKVIATTHFHEIFHNDLLNPYRLPITFLHMQVLLTSPGGGTDVLGENPLEGDDNDDTRARVSSSDKTTYLYK